MFIAKNVWKDEPENKKYKNCVCFFVPVSKSTFYKNIKKKNHAKVNKMIGK